MAEQLMRNRLIETALTLGYQHGFHALGVDRIAKAAGTTRATLYNHFESKDDLILAVVKQRDKWWQKTFTCELFKHGGDDPIARLRGISEVLREWFASDGFHGCLFINTASEFPSVHDPVHQAAKANVDAIRHIITQTATEAGIRAPERFAQQINMVIEGAIVTEVIDRDGQAPTTAAMLIDALISTYIPEAAVN